MERRLRAESAGKVIDVLAELFRIRGVPQGDCAILGNWYE